MKKLAAKAADFIRAWDGPLTKDLVQTPGDFGLGEVPERLKPDDTTTMVCGFCSTGCGLNIHLKDGQAINLSADTHYPVNLGMACPKGWEALTPLAAPDRATTPLLRNEPTGELEPVDWDRALTLFCERFKEIKRKHGPESVAFLGTGQIVTEEMAFLGALFKFGMGFVHCDSNTRQCMATSTVAYKQSFGFDAPPFTYADFEESDVLVFIGANPCRIGLLKKVARAPGQALSDFNICKLVAQYWGCGEMFARWTSPEAVFQLMKECSRDQSCDITGIVDYRMIDECGGVQWPLAESRNAKGGGGKNTDGPLDSSAFQQRRLFGDGHYFHADGRAKFLFEAPRAMAEPVDAEFPFLLLTGRGTSSQWHTNTRTGKSDVLRKLYPVSIYIEINPLDAARLGIAANTLVTIASRRAQITATACITTTVQPGQIFAPMHYARVNQLTFPSFDPYSRQPSYKACAVSVAPFAR